MLMYIGSMVILTYNTYDDVYSWSKTEYSHIEEFS